MAQPAAASASSLQASNSSNRSDADDASAAAAAVKRPSAEAAFRAQVALWPAVLTHAVASSDWMQMHLSAALAFLRSGQLDAAGAIELIREGAPPHIASLLTLPESIAASSSVAVLSCGVYNSPDIAAALAVLPVLDEAKVLDHIGMDWNFYCELIGDALAEISKFLERGRSWAALDGPADGGNQFRFMGDVLLGSAEHLRLPALANLAIRVRQCKAQVRTLVDPSNPRFGGIRCERVIAAIQSGAWSEADIDEFDRRQRVAELQLFDHLQQQYERLRAIVPYIQHKAAMEALEDGEEEAEEGQGGQPPPQALSSSPSHSHAA
jgi:hypothetical protein